MCVERDIPEHGDHPANIEIDKISDRTCTAHGHTREPGEREVHLSRASDLRVSSAKDKEPKRHETNLGSQIAEWHMRRVRAWNFVEQYECLAE
jgi:hypothetical protein